MARTYARLVDALIAGVVAGLLFSVLLPIASRFLFAMGNPMPANSFPSEHFAYAYGGVLTAVAFWYEQAYWKTGMSHIVSWTAWHATVTFALTIAAAYIVQEIHLYDVIRGAYFLSLPLIPAAIVGATVAQLSNYMLMRKQTRRGPQ